MCRYVPHWGEVTPFGHSKERLPTLQKNFPTLGPLDNYLADFQEVFNLGAFLLSSDEHIAAVRYHNYCFVGVVSGTRRRNSTELAITA